MNNSLLKNLNDSIKRKQYENVPVVLWNTGPFVARFAGMKIGDYSRTPELKLKAQTFFMKTFPDVIMFPGIQADFGVTPVPSAFGCEVSWAEDDVPHVKPAISNIEEIKKLRVINPKTDGLLPKSIETYRYFWDNVDKDLIEKYGYLDGLGFTMGPVEVGALVIGYDRFLKEILKHPKSIHELLKITTESCLTWISAQQNINGKIKRLILVDHIPGQVGPEHFQEFCLPYYQEVFKEFPDAVKIYHNENNVTKMLSGIGEIDADVFHFGVNVKETKENIGSKMCLMGNLKATGNLLNGTPEQVFQEATECLDIGAVGGGFLLSTAGGMAPGTSEENIKAMIQAAREWKPKP